MDQTHKERQQVTLVLSLHVAGGPVCDTARLQGEVGRSERPGCASASACARRWKTCGDVKQACIWFS